jgi:Tfp pilus assembly protein FimV
MNGGDQTTKSGFCSICKEWTDDLQDHHIHKQAVFGRGKQNNRKAPVCQYCHQNIEYVITQEENEILREHKKNLYERVFNDFKTRRIDADKVNAERLASNGKRRRK